MAFVFNPITGNLDVVNGTPTGDVNTLAIYDNNGDLSSLTNFGYDPALFNRMNWNHNVIPAVDNNFYTIHQWSTSYNPIAADSKEGFNHLFIEAGIGTDDSGFQVGDPSDVKSTLTEQDVTFTSTRRGTDGDVVSMQYTAGGTAGSEILTNPTQFEYILQIEDGVSTAQQIVDAINAQVGNLGNNLSAAVSGTASDPQVIFGPTFLAGGENDEGGLNVFGISLFSRNKSNVGYINGSNFYLDIGNNTDQIDISYVRAFGGNITLHDNTSGRGISVFEYNTNISNTNSSIGYYRGINLNGNLGIVDDQISGVGVGLNVNTANYVEGFRTSFAASGNIIHSVNQFADFSNFSGDIGDNYYGVAIQPNINTTDGFYGVNISPNVTSSRGFSAGLNINMENIGLAAGTKASLIIQDITLEAQLAGTGLNGLTVEYINDVLAGNEVANVVGNAIEVHIESGVSTATQVKAAYEANVQIVANLTITITGIASNPQVTQAPTPLAGGTDGGSKVGINLNNGELRVNNGKSNLSYTLDTSTSGTLEFVYGLNNLGGQFHVASGFPITGGQFGVGTNFGVNTSIEDDIDPDLTTFGLGFSMVGILTQIGVAAGKTADAVNFMNIAASIPSGSGNITNLSYYRATGLIPQGGTINVTNLYGFKIEPLLNSVSATNAWGFWNGDTTTHNYLSNDLVIGGTSGLPSNTDTALDIQSLKAMRLSNLTTAQKLALAALPGMIVYDTDLGQISYYNGSWINL